MDIVACIALTIAFFALLSMLVLLIVPQWIVSIENGQLGAYRSSVFFKSSIVIFISLLIFAFTAPPSLREQLHPTHDDGSTIWQRLFAEKKQPLPHQGITGDELDDIMEQAESIIEKHEDELAAKKN